MVRLGLLKAFWNLKTQKLKKEDDFFQTKSAATGPSSCAELCVEKIFKQNIIWCLLFCFRLLNSKMTDPCSSLLVQKTASDRSETESTKSYNSEDLEEMKEKYDETPHDVFFEVDKENVRVLKRGDKVPCETKYKKVKNGTAAVKFRWIRLLLYYSQ